MADQGDNGGNGQAGNDELARLREHNQALLAELKAAKVKLGGIEHDRDTAIGALSTSRAELHRLKVELPVDRVLEELAMPGAAGAVKVLLQQRGITFDQDEHGELVVLKDGKRAFHDLNAQGQQTPVGFEAVELAQWIGKFNDETLNHLVRGVSAGRFLPLVVPKPHVIDGGVPDGKPAPAPAQQFGLR